VGQVAIGQNEWSMSRVELRRYDRYRLGAPVVFWWEDAEGVRQEGTGVTRDISTIGIYVVSTSCPATGTRVHLRVSLPSLHGNVPGWRLEAQGRVVRLESSEGDETTAGFAVSNGELMAKLKTQSSL
jgi:hypothetical protein